MGRRKAPKVAGTFGSGGRNHPWAEEQARSSLEPPAASNHTRPMSWLGPASSGVYPHTNGARFCTGGHRHRIPLTTKGLRVARAVRQAIGRPFAVGGRNADQQNARDAVRGEATFRSRGRSGQAGRAHGSRRRCALGVPQGVRDKGHAADGGHGSRGTGSGQEPLRPLRRGREAPRLDVPDSTGSVPLQSG